MTYRNRVALVAGVLLAVGSPAAAQDVTTYLVAAADGNETNIELIGVSLRPGERGLQPVLSAQAYRLGYDGGQGGVTVYSFTPAIGLGYRTSVGSVEVKQGYTFQSEESNVLFFEGSEGGLKTSAQALYWGGGPQLEGLGSYSWEEGSVYSQALAAFPVADLDPGQLSIGGEVAWQGDLGDSDEYRSTSVGPVLRWASGGPLIATVSGGWKNSNVTDSTYYLKLGLVFAP